MASPNSKQRRIFFQKKRANVVLSREEIKAIKSGRKTLRKEMKARGIRSKREFELTAGSLGLYFDKRSGLLAWLWSHWLGALIGSLLAFLAIMFLFSTVQAMRGHYTVNISNDMLKEGFVISDSVEFVHPTTTLFAKPANEVPCVSISQIPLDIDEIDGEHNDTYFAYTYYIKNDGESTVDYTWSLDIKSETQELSEAIWIIVIEDGEMRFFAKENLETGREEALPSFGDDSRGYLNLPIRELAPDSEQFEIIAQQGNSTYWRVIPYKFLSDTQITTGEQTGVAPMDTHKYTVVMFLEGDDEQAVDDKIGGRIGLEMKFKLAYEDDNDSIGQFFKKVFKGLEYK